MSATAFNFNVATQNTLRGAITNLVLGYVATWSVIGSGADAETILDLGTIYPNRRIRINFPKASKPTLTVTALTPDLRKSLEAWGQPALAAITNELNKWRTRGDVME